MTEKDAEAWWVKFTEASAVNQMACQEVHEAAEEIAAWADGRLFGFDRTEHATFAARLKFLARKVAAAQKRALKAEARMAKIAEKVPQFFLSES